MKLSKGEQAIIMLQGFVNDWKANMKDPDAPIPGCDAVDYLVAFFYDARKLCRRKS